MTLRILVTGRPGSGKTTAVVRAADLLRDRGVALAGFVTEEVRERGRRIGFDLVTLDGRRAPLARVGLVAPVTVGRYGVDTTVVETLAVPVLQARTGLIVVDEIAPMELAAPGFRAAVYSLLEREQDVLGTVHHGRAREFPPRVEIIDLATVDRDRLPARLADRFADARA